MSAGLDAVPCLVRPDLADADDQQLAAALAENIQREALSPQEEARAYAQLSAFPGWSAGRIAQATGRDELSVRRSIEAMVLAPELQPAAISGQLSLEDAARVASGNRGDAAQLGPGGFGAPPALPCRRGNAGGKERRC